MTSHWDPSKNNLIVITKAKDNQLVSFTKNLAEWLIFTPRFGREHPFVVYVDGHLKDSSRFNIAQSIEENPIWESNLKYWTPKLCYKSPNLFHLIITLGGDGTILFTSTMFQANVPPIMPFHLGSLGFLAPFPFTSYREHLTRLFDGELESKTNRMRLSCTIYKYRADPYCLLRDKRGCQSDKIWRTKAPTNSDNTISEQDKKYKWEMMETVWMQRVINRATKTMPEDVDILNNKVMCYSTYPTTNIHVLNELVIDRGPNSSISVLELFVDDDHLTTVQADGLCIATATGSTAYSLSANGSLTHPDMQCILVTPICPHTLSFRPMLLPSNATIRVLIPFGSRNTAYCSFDGRHRIELKHGDHIKITVSPHSVDTVSATNTSNDWFSSVQTCLQWNHRQRQKSFVIIEDESKKSDTQNEPTATSGDVKKMSESEEYQLFDKVDHDLIPWTEEELANELDGK
ncbi:ATP-NAD kinase-like domain-containing protein [Pilobolus umbonatus]|nr:ATP-NAD kinase-like domain-containing protein [Pilobolus umbonatus]